jgi:hypothetical protein
MPNPILAWLRGDDLKREPAEAETRVLTGRQFVHGYLVADPTRRADGTPRLGDTDYSPFHVERRHYTVVEQLPNGDRVVIDPSWELTHSA